MNKVTALLLLCLFYIIRFAFIELIITGLFFYTGYLVLQMPEPSTAVKVHEVSVFLLIVFWAVQCYVMAIKLGIIEYRNSEDYDAYLA